MLTINTHIVSRVLTITMTMFGVLIIVCCITGHVLSLNKQSIELTALDCRHPKGIVRSPVNTLCEHTDNTLTDKSRSVHILQYDRARVIPAVTCSLVKTTMLAYCGSFSHSKIYEPLSIMVPEQISHDTCVQVYKTSLYSQEDGKTATITVNRPHTYKYLGHGSLKTSSANIECQGEQFSIHGKLHSNMLELVTATFTLHKVSVEFDPNEGVKDLDTGYSLPHHCMTDMYCYQYSKLYVMLAPRFACPLYLVRSINMVETKYMGTDQKEHVALVSKEHQLIIEVKGEFNIPKSCHDFPKVHNTNYEKIKLVIGKMSPHVASAVHSYTLDLSLQAQILHDYANFHAERLINSRIDETLHQLCETNHFGVHTAEIDPIRAGYVMQRTGEIFTRFACTNVTVIARVGSNSEGKCYANALPVYLGREKLALTANTRVLLELHDAHVTTCSSQFPPVFISKNGQVLVANPTVRKVNFTLQNMDLPIFHEHTKTRHESADHFSLYTKDELEEFNILLHFGRTKEAVLTELTEKYCTGQACGSLDFQAGGQTFDLNRLRNQIENTISLAHQFENAAQYCGKVGGCLFILYFSIKVLLKLLNMTHLYFSRKCSLEFSLHTSVYRDRAIDNLIIIEHLRTLEKKKVTKERSNSGETLTSNL